MPFDQLLQQIADEADRTSLGALAAKYPSFKQFLSHGDFGERVAQSQPDLEALGYREFAPALRELSGWRGWKKDAWDPELKMTVGERDARRIATEMETKVQELESRSNAEMTPEEIRSVVKETLQAEGVVSNAGLENRITKALSKDGEVYKFVLDAQNGQSGRFEEVYTKITPLMIQHSKDFDGEVLNIGKVFEHMNDMSKKRNVHVQNIDPSEAYNDLMAPRIAEKKQKEIDAKITAAREEGIKEGQRKALEGPSGRGNPVGSGNSKTLGPVERARLAKIEAQKDKGVPAPLGRGVIAAQAAQAHREKEMNATP